MVNPLLILAFIPLFQTVVYPLLDKCHILTTPLQRLVCGGTLAAIAFVISACIWLALEAKAPVLPSEGNAQIRIYNTLPCNVTIMSEIDPKNTFTISKGDFYTNIDLEQQGNKSFPFSLTNSCAQLQGNFELYEGESSGYYFTNGATAFFLDDVSISEDGFPRIR